MRYRTGTYLIPTRTNKINDIRAKTISATPPRFEPESKPHISIIPQCVFPTQDKRARAMGELKNTMENWNREIEITGLQVWPKWGVKKNGFLGPIVIALDVLKNPEEIEQLREKQLQIIQKHDGEVDYKIADPHLTLVKAENKDENVTGLNSFEEDQVKPKLPDVKPFSLQFKPEIREI